MLLRACLLLFCAASLFAQPPQPPAHAPLALKTPLQDKNFYILSLLARDPAVARDLSSDPALQRLTASKLEALRQAANCRDSVACFTAPLRLSPEEIDSAAQALETLAAKSAPLRALTAGPLRRSGAYYRLANLPDSALLAAAWRHAAAGINRVIDIYGDGKPPRYPAVDSISFDVSKPAWRGQLQVVADLLLDDPGSFKLFFDPSLAFALRLLELNHRDEAARFEPLELGENRAAARRIPTIRFSAFPYSVIVVPGAGSDRTTWALSATGHMRCEMAARRFREKKAPLILVSGGYVHPAQTPNCEALEMKRALIRDFGIPEDAILIDPHARHTTTNLRNAARILFRDGVPLDRKTLIVTDRSQSASIESDGFRRRCETEMGHMPIKVLSRLSLFDLEALFLPEALQIDPIDPLDP